MSRGRLRAHGFTSRGRPYNRDAEKVVRAGNRKQARDAIKLRKLNRNNKTPFVRGGTRTYSQDELPEGSALKS